MRILDLFEQLAEDVVDAAADPAGKLLVEKFKEVDTEILAAFGDHSEPLNEAAEALIQRREKNLRSEDAQADKLAIAIESAVAATPVAVAVPARPSWLKPKSAVAAIPNAGW